MTGSKQRLLGCCLSAAAVVVRQLAESLRSSDRLAAEQPSLRSSDRLAAKQPSLRSSGRLAAKQPSLRSSDLRAERRRA